MSGRRGEVGGGIEDDETTRVRRRSVVRVVQVLSPRSETRPRDVVALPVASQVSFGHGCRCLVSLVDRVCRPAMSSPGVKERTVGV